jgi:hypothetical protein
MEDVVGILAASASYSTSKYTFSGLLSAGAGSFGNPSTSIADGYHEVV